MTGLDCVTLSWEGRGGLLTGLMDGGYYYRYSLPPAQSPPRHQKRIPTPMMPCLHYLLLISKLSFFLIPNYWKTSSGSAAKNAFICCMNKKFANKYNKKGFNVLCLSGCSFESPHLQIMKVWQRRLINDNNKKTSDDNNMKTIKKLRWIEY